MRIAQVLGLVALVAGLVGALGPAERIHNTYSWPPPVLPVESPASLWYTPLLLVRHQPETIAANVTCTLPDSLPGGAPGHVLSTARHPERVNGLAIMQSATELVVRLGRDVLTRVALPAERGGDCSHRVTLTDGRWFVSGGDGIERHGRVRVMPTVYGLFSALDLGASRPLAVDVTTIAHATRVTLRQIVAWVVAALAGVAALLLVATADRPMRARRTPLGPVRRALASAHPADALVALVLLGWCVIAPVNFDDGWVIQREQMFATSNGFSAYYSLLAVNLPLDYWLEWLHHWLAEASNELVVFRLAVLVVLMAVWILCRWLASQMELASAGRDRLGLWTLAWAFLLGSLAWGMTLRPEPVTALFVTGVAACVARFVQREDDAVVALAAILVVLALTAHPAGVVSLAPVVIAAPQLFRWARARLPQAVTIISASIALLATLAFVGADLDQRVADADTTQALSGNSRDEIQRYAFLWEEPFGTPLRRAFVALLLLAVAAYFIRRREDRGGLLGYPASVLAVGLVLLVATPSKWPSHFGAFVGVGALALAAESARLRAAGRRTGGWALPLLAVGAATLATIWSWWEREPWNTLDLRTLDWEPAFISRLGLSQLAVLLPALLLFGSLLVARFRRRRADPWRVASWIPIAVAIPAIAFTAGVLVVDAAKTSSWTLTRQNLSSLTGDAGCGLADDVLVSRERSSKPLAPARDGRTVAPPAWVPSAPVRGLPRYALGPAGADASYSPWFKLPRRRTVGLFVAGTPGPADTVWVEWGRAAQGRTEPVGSGEITEVVSEKSGNAPWRFFAAGDLPPPHPDATSMRIEYRPGVSPGNAIAITSPVTYENERLATKMTQGAVRSLVYPELYLYFPCRQLPALHDGIVEVPQYVVIGRTESPPLRYHVTSPFVGLLDLYALARVPVADTDEQVDRLRVFEVDRAIPGAVVASPASTTFVS